MPSVESLDNYLNLSGQAAIPASIAAEWPAFPRVVGSVW